MVADARSTPVRERPGPHRRGGPSSFPLLARTQTFRRPVAKAAYDCAMVTGTAAYRLSPQSADQQTLRWRSHRGRPLSAAATEIQGMREGRAG